MASIPRAFTTDTTDTANIVYSWLQDVLKASASIETTGGEVSSRTSTKRSCPFPETGGTYSKQPRFSSPQAVSYNTQQGMCHSTDYSSHSNRHDKTTKLGTATSNTEGFHFFQATLTQLDMILSTKEADTDTIFVPDNFLIGNKGKEEERHRLVFTRDGRVETLSGWTIRKLQQQPLPSGRDDPDPELTLEKWRSDITGDLLTVQSQGTERDKEDVQSYCLSAANPKLQSLYVDLFLDGDDDDDTDDDDDDGDSEDQEGDDKNFALGNEGWKNVAIGNGSDGNDEQENEEEADGFKAVWSGDGFQFVVLGNEDLEREW